MINPTVSTAFDHALLAIEAGDGITASQLLDGRWKQGNEKQQTAVLLKAVMKLGDRSYSQFVKNLKK